MEGSKSLPGWLHARQTKGSDVSSEFAAQCGMTSDMVERLGLDKELEGHSGCVNCIQWNPAGRLLASGSDDKTVIIWDGLVGKLIARVDTPHEGNIFDVVWLPGSEDQLVGTGAGDCKVCLVNIETGTTVREVSGHQSRVKRLATSVDSPGVLWSGGEDGLVRQWDLREKWTQDSNNVLVNLPRLTGLRGSECKCISLCPGRSELVAVGANDPYVRVFDRRMITLGQASFSADSPDDSGVVSYFVPGHLPGAEASFHKKLRPLTSTYLTYNAEGTELLVNLGGEQIYLYDKFALYSTESTSLSKITASLYCDTSTPRTNGYKTQSPTSMPPQTESLKISANGQFEAGDYLRAVGLYNRAVASLPTKHPAQAVLAANRAAALMKRGWDGDTYAALRDCLTALSIDPGHIKAHLRLARCMTDLEWLNEASDCLELFKAKYPEHKKSGSCSQLETDLALSKEKELKLLQSNKTTTNVMKPLGRYTAASFLRDSPGGENMDLDSDDSEDEMVDVDSSSTPLPPPPRPPGQEPNEKEIVWRRRARDFSTRFLGACNTTTDIKEANFLGGNGQFIMAGSDDGKFFIWDRVTSNIVKVLVGDESIVNCLQTHPTSPILATSGIDPVVRLWHPRPEDGLGDQSRCVPDLAGAAVSNQRRMNADPFETILLNMGYRMNVDEETGEPNNEGSVQCRPS